MAAPLYRRCAAEAFGTFFLVFAGTGAIVFEVSHVGVALAFGLVVMAMIYAVGGVSGAHLNPAVTLGFVAARRFPARDAVPYLVAQLVGAFAASGLLSAITPHAPHRLGQTLPGSGILPRDALVVEAILTLALMYAILGVVASKPDVRALGGLIIGGVVGLEALFAGPITGASMNPARSLAPAFVSGIPSMYGLYVAGPILGALLAVPLWNFINVSPPETKS
jgi:aquaporin NIP